VIPRVAAAVFVAGAFSFGGAAASPSPAPALRLLDRSPLSVRGERFQPRERVRLIITGDVAAKRTLRTDPSGRFVANFEAITATRCDMIRVVAVGGSGGRAQLKLLPAPACMPE
jgi:hypothetical protein